MQDNTEQLYFLTQLYRDFLLPTILGNDNSEILYWAGRRAASHYSLNEVADLTEFFQMANLGTLSLIKEKKTNYIFELSGQIVQDRIASGSMDFTLESGIIAETVEKQVNKPAAATVSISKDQKVRITAAFE